MPDSTLFQTTQLTRVQWCRILLRLAAARGGSARDAVRVFYHLALKPSLAFRGWARFDPSRILSLSVRGPGHPHFAVHARDNGSDVGTFEEFFSSRHTVIPPDLPPLEAKVVYDIGANIGIASLYFASAFPRARFFGFEPVPQNYEVCRLNYGNLRDSDVFPWAIGQQTGVSTFEFVETDLRGGGLHGAQTIGEAGGRKQIEVQVYSLADLVTVKKLPPPDFVKIDVEGAELEVLKGIGQEGRSIRRMLVETHSEQLRADCMRWMMDHGFVILHVHSLPGGFSSVWCDRL